MTNVSIEQVRISGLFGQYDYLISLHREITIITSPNGYGKTNLLKAISFFAQKKFYALRTQIVFDTLEYDLSDGFKYRVENIVDNGDASNQLLKIYRINSENNEILNTFNVSRLDLEGLQRLVVRNLPWLTRISETEWIHDDTREIYSEFKLLNYLEEQRLISTHSRTTQTITKSVISNLIGEPLPDWLSNLNIQVMFIPTDRLQNQVSVNDSTTRIRSEYMRSRVMSDSQSSVRDISERIKQKYKDTIQIQFSKGRELESTFVHRLLNQSKQKQQLSIDLLQKNIREYEETFVNVGLIQSSADLAQSENVDKKYQDVVGLYYQDIIEKFKLMESFADNLQKFIETLNDLYTTKKVRTSQNGLTITFNDKNLDLDSLSSGEKHVIVMFGKLIFDTADDMLLLIDEPEISLHPAWQERFMEIVRQIQSQHKNVKIVIATHSPLIFGGFIDSDDIVDLEQIEGMVQ